MHLSSRCGALAAFICLGLAAGSEAPFSEGICRNLAALHNRRIELQAELEHHERDRDAVERIRQQRDANEKEYKRQMALARAFEPPEWPESPNLDRLPPRGLTREELAQKADGGDGAAAMHLASLHLLRLGKGTAADIPTCWNDRQAARHRLEQAIRSGYPGASFLLEYAARQDEAAQPESFESYPTFAKALKDGDHLTLQTALVQNEPALTLLCRHALQELFARAESGDREARRRYLLISDSPAKHIKHDPPLFSTGSVFEWSAEAGDSGELDCMDMWLRHCDGNELAPGDIGRIFRYMETLTLAGYPMFRERFDPDSRLALKVFYDAMESGQWMSFDLSRKRTLLTRGDPDRLVKQLIEYWSNDRVRIDQTADRLLSMGEHSWLLTFFDSGSRFDSDIEQRTVLANRAEELLRRRAGQNDPDACLALARLHLDPPPRSGRPPDSQKAIPFIRQALKIIQQEPPQDTRLLLSARILQLKADLVQHVTAATWQQTAKTARELLDNLDQRTRYAKGDLYFILGHLYQHAPDSLADASEARDFYQRGINSQDNTDCLIGLGSLYEHGQGVERDLDKAIELYRRASSRVSRRAEENLRRLGIDPDDH